MVEYFQPNTHKELHVGHMRNLCLGNALCRIWDYEGNTVIPVTYPGDVGTHVAKCLWYYKNINKEPTPKTIQEKGRWIGSMYSKANNYLEDQRGTENEEKNRAELTAILKQLHAGEGEYFDLWKESREWSIELMREVCEWSDVKFEKWYWEGDMDAPSLAMAKELYEKGVFVKDDGAIGIDLSDDKLGFCMVIKSDGTGLYATKDIKLAQVKFDEYKMDKNYYIVDVRQSLHFKQVFKTLEKIGYERASECHHIAYEFVELPSGAMSSRSGNIVPLEDLIDQVQAEIQSRYLDRYEDWSEEKKKMVAKQVANGAIKYGMIRMENNKKIVFDMEEWLKLEGETGPYLQYVHARINSLLKKHTDTLDSIKWEKLEEEIEGSLLAKLALFNDMVALAARAHKTPTLCSYLFELAKLYNNFYANCPIGKEEDSEKRVARLALSKSVMLVMRKGLELLGIEAPLEM